MQYSISSNNYDLISDHILKEYDFLVIFFVFLNVRTTKQISTHFSLLVTITNKVSIFSTSDSIQSSRYSYGSSYDRSPVGFSLTVDLTWFLHACTFGISIFSKKHFILFNLWKNSLLSFFCILLFECRERIFLIKIQLILIPLFF